MRKKALKAIVVPILALIVVLLFPALAAAQEKPSTFNDPLFEETWEAFDADVLDGTSGISWTWGPAYAPAAHITKERYSNAPGGMRTVQYFDKSRMEDNSYRADGLWAVTNGLLVVELVTGRMQVGDFEFVQCSPSDHPVAGDPDQDDDALTYADLADGFAPDAYEWDPVFAGFLTEHNGEYTVGLASTAPKTITATVGGVEREVLVQAGERRVLTYTEGNPVSFLAEWGNVGQHYYEWRYGDEGCGVDREPVPPPPPPADDIPSTHAQGFDITNRCPDFRPVAGHDVCAIPSGVSGEAEYVDNRVVFTHNRQVIGDAAMVLRIRANPEGAEAVQVSGNDRIKVWFQTSLSGDLTCAEENDCRADDDGNAVVTIPRDGEIILYVGSQGPEGYEVTYTFGSLDELEGNVIDSSLYIWK